MAGSTRIYLIIAYAAILADCRLRGNFSKQKITKEINSNAVAEHILEQLKPVTDRVILEEQKTPDSDAIVFPSDDDDTEIYPDLSKIMNEEKKLIDTTRTTDTLLPKVVPAVEAKEVFTNPILTDVTYKDTDLKENIKQKPIQDTEEGNIKANDEIISVTNNITLNSNVTAPDFSNRFGENSNYMIVPVNNQNYQPIQTNLQGNIPQYNQGNLMNPLNENLQNTNVVQIAPYNTNSIPQGTNHVPITVSNTYMINGQLYAALTIPNNMNVPNSIYLINPQIQQTGFQVNNELPVYKLVEQGQRY